MNLKDQKYQSGESPKCLDFYQSSKDGFHFVSLTFLLVTQFMPIFLVSVGTHWDYVTIVVEVNFFIYF
jgi:hypothetical protein